MLKEFLLEAEKKQREDGERELLFVISNDDGWRFESASLPGTFGWMEPFYWLELT